MKASASYNRDPDVVRYREEAARRAKRPKATRTKAALAARMFRSFKVGRTKPATPELRAPRIRPTERQRVLYAIEMEDLRRMERGRHVGF